MTDRNADMRHILSQVQTLTGGTVMSESPLAMTKKGVATGLPARLPATPENIAKAKEFVMQKWLDRYAERYANDRYAPPEPSDLSPLGWLGQRSVIAKS